MMNNELNDFERRLLELSRSDAAFLRYRRNSILNSVLFSVLFAMAVYVIDWNLHGSKLYVMVVGILAVYSLLSCLTVVNFQRILEAHRSLLGKLSGTSVEECPEKQSRINMILLTAFFWCLLLAVLLLQLPGKSFYLAGGFAFFMLLSAMIKYRYACIVIDCKHRCAKYADTVK